MSNTQNCFCWHRNRHAKIYLLLLLVSSFTYLDRFMAEGRAISKRIEPTQKGHLEEDDVVRVVARARQIGSRPPSCERRCSSCGHCEAVQVPISPQLHNHSKRNRSFYVGSSSSTRTRTRTRTRETTQNEAYSRREGISNYKPMSWKCKCGNVLFNP